MELAVINCEWWEQGRCKRNMFGGRPSVKNCEACLRGENATGAGHSKESRQLDDLMDGHHADPLLGDRLEAWAQAIGADKAAVAWVEWTGFPCGCGWRKNKLNELNSLWRAVREKLGG